MIPPNRPRGHALRVLRLCSTFEMPSGRPDPRAARFDAIGGMQTHTGELTRALDALGVAQRVVTAWRPGAPRVDRFGRAAVVLRLGVPTRRLRQCYALPAAHVLNRLAARADLVHAHLGEDLAVVPLALAMVRRHGLPLVLTVHTSPRHTMAVTGPRSAYLHALGGWWERLGERRADQVIALTPRLARLLTADGVPAARLSVVPSGIREELFAGPPVADPLAGLPRPRVVFLGRLHPQKNVPLLLAAMARLPAPGAHLVLVGDGPERARLELLRDRLGLRGVATFLGFVAHDEVPAVLQAADVLALPSRYEELGTGGWRSGSRSGRSGAGTDCSRPPLVRCGAVHPDGTSAPGHPRGRR